jgi:hypothetical protein
LGAASALGLFVEATCGLLAAAGACADLGAASVGGAFVFASSAFGAGDSPNNTTVVNPAKKTLLVDRFGCSVFIIFKQLCCDFGFMRFCKPKRIEHQRCNLRWVG